jgi:superoxide dismutase, Fe-Mn family
MVNSPLPGTADATTKPQRLVEKHGRTPAQASLFNHASMACNNHMFFNCLSPQKTEPSPSFAADLNESFSSYDTLRTEMIETADAMFGPGFVWIVKDQEAGKMKLLCTYLAGSPYPLAHLRSQQTDMATFNSGSGYSGRSANHVGAFGPYSRTGMAQQRAPGGYNSYPVLCVNTWEHAYLRDYGVGGKRKYLERWWDRIDWAVVENNAKVYGPERRDFGGPRLSSYMSNSFQKYQPRTT